MKQTRGEGARRGSVSALAAACATMGLAGFSANQANASLVIDVLALPGTGYSVSAGGKSVSDAANGTTVNFGVFATLTGTNNVQVTGDFDEQNDGTDRRNDDSLQILVGSFSSVGSLLADLNPTPGELSYNSHRAPFSAGGSTNGVARDFDSDGDLDIGRPGVVTDLQIFDLWAARSGSPTYAARFDSATNGWTFANGGFAEDDGDQIISPSSSRLRVGTLKLQVTGGSGSTLVNYIPRTPVTTDNAVALWFEDGQSTGKNVFNAPFSVGAPVVVQLNSIPEPTAATVAASVAVIGLLTRRPDQRRGPANRN